MSRPLVLYSPPSASLTATTLAPISWKMRAAKGNIDDRALPGHPHRQGSDFVKVRKRAIAYPAFSRAARNVVLHPITGKYVGAAVLHLDGEMNGQFALRVFEDLVHAGLEF